MKIKLVNEDIKTNYGVNLLRARGVEDVEKFINPTEDALQDWRDLKDIKKGVNLIFALPNKAHIGIVVDCDVDGFTSASIIGQYLKEYLPQIDIKYYIHEGKAHGLEEHWQDIQEMNFDLLIVPDAGSNDSQYVELIDCPILVIDHHILESPVTASNLILINNQVSPKYKNKDLSGAGLAYQFCRAMDYYFDKKFADNYIDLAALGVCADMMSGLEIENQFIWRKGFSKINNYFFWSIAQKQSYSITGKRDVSDEDLIEALTPTTVAFYVVPMINAMIRVGTMEEKERMLTAFIDGHKMVPCKKRGAKGTFEEVAIESVRECVNARSNQNSSKEKAILKLDQKIFKNDLLENSILFIRLEDEDDFPSELNGLIAMNLSQRYKKPTIVARLNDEDYIRGSIRGLSNSELVSFKDYLSSTGLFEYVQGHDNAAGCSIWNGNLNLLHQVANEELSKYDFGEKYYEVNFKRKATEPDLEDLVHDLTQYKFLWSHQNPEPLIYISNLLINSSDIQIMGKNKNTIKFIKNNVIYIKFFAKDLIEEISRYNNIKLELVGKANLNEWNGVFTPQVFIESFEIKEDSIFDF